MNLTILLYVICIMVLTNSIARSYHDCKLAVKSAATPVKEAGYIALFLVTITVYMALNGLLVREILLLIS